MVKFFMNSFLVEPHGARCKAKLPENFVISSLTCACLRSATDPERETSEFDQIEICPGYYTVQFPFQELRVEVKIFIFILYPWIIFFFF